MTISKSSRTKLVLQLVCLLALLLVSACNSIPLQAVSTFAIATDSLAESGHRAYELVDESRIDREIYDVASNPDQAPKDTTFAPLVSPSDRDTYEALQLRFELLSQLGAYAAALRTLCETDFASEIDEAATDLNGALVELRGTYQKVTGTDAPIGEDQLALIATAVSAIGKEVVEAKRRAAVKTIIQETDTTVRNTAALLSRDLGGASKMASFAEQNLSNAYGSARTAYLRERNQMSFDERLVALDRLRQMKEAELEVKPFFESVSKGAAAVAKGHGQMKHAVSNDDYSIRGLTSTVGEIAKRAKEAKKFYKTLQASEVADAA